MNQKINADIKSLVFIFNKNKSYIYPVLIILVSILLFFQFVIPQVRMLNATQKKTKEALVRLETSKANLHILENVNESILDSQLEIAKAALPLDKNYIGILNSIYSAAQKTGVSLGNFSFKVGDLSQSKDDDKFSVISLSLPVNSPIMAINSFVETISKTMPLVNVSSVKMRSSSSTIGLSFYYKSLDISKYSQDARINPISQKGLDLINLLRGYDKTYSTGQ